MRSSRKISAVLGAAALATGTLVAVAQPASAAVARLTLSWVPQNSLGTAKSATLTCLPTGGTHPYAELACADLMAAGGDISKIAPVPGHIMCPPVYIPYQLKAVGWWGWRPINYSRTAANDCDARAAAGGNLFDL
jgi:subtilisin inhibitor-like